MLSSNLMGISACKAVWNRTFSRMTQELKDAHQRIKAIKPIEQQCWKVMHKCACVGIMNGAIPRSNPRASKRSA